MQDCPEGRCIGVSHNRFLKQVASATCFFVMSLIERLFRAFLRIWVLEDEILRLWYTRCATTVVSLDPRVCRLRFAVTKATSYLCSACNHRGALLGAEPSSCPKMWCGGFLHGHGDALLGKTATECTLVVASATTRVHHWAGIFVPATKCAGMAMAFLRMNQSGHSTRVGCRRRSTIAAVITSHLLFFNFL